MNAPGADPRIAIVDYGRGNLFSMARALERVGAVPDVTESGDALRAAEAVVLPGVGAFCDAMAGLQQRGLVEVLRDLAARGVPLLGVCLGMQILFSRSEEFGDCEGLGIIPGAVRRLPDYRRGPDAMRIPNVGWRRLERQAASPLLDRVSDGAMFYFVHSFVPEPARPEDVAGTLEVNGRRAAVLVQCGNVFGCQFHPEKSGPEGLAFLQSFKEHVAGISEARRVA